MFGFRKRTKEPEIHSEEASGRDNNNDGAPTTESHTQSTKECSQSQTEAPFCTSEDELNKNPNEKASQVPVSSSDEAPVFDNHEGNGQPTQNSSPPHALESCQTHPSLPSQEPTSTSLPLTSSPSLLTWDEALYQACVQNQTLAQTPRQVLQQHHHVLRPRQDDVLLTTQTNVAMEIAKKLSSLPPTTNTTSTSMTRVVWNGVASIASKVYQYTVADPDDYMDQDLDTFEQDDDAHTTQLVEWNDSVVCVELVVECLLQLIPHCKEEITAVRTGGTKMYSFATWVATHSTIQVQQRDLHLLQQVLMEGGHAQVSGEFLILGDSSLRTDTSVQVVVSLTQLQEAIDACRDLNQARQMEIVKHTRLAADKKRNQDTQGALRELHLCKQLRAQVDSTSAHLLNLHQAHDSLQSAHFQATHVVKPLEDAAAALKTLRQNVPLERVDDVMLDLQEQMELVNNVSERIASSSGIQANDFDEDELLAELEQMTIEDFDLVVPDSSIVKRKESGVEPQEQLNQEETEDETVSNKVSDSAGVAQMQQISSGCENEGATHNTNDGVAAAMPAE